MPKPLPTLLLALTAAITPGTLAAEEPEQIPKLVEMLLNADGYRVRVQAAYSLGAFRNAEAQDALLSALMDPHEAVRVAALVSLAKIGDATVIPLLRGSTDDNPVVLEQLRHTLVLLEERYPDARLPMDWSRAKGVLEIESIKDESGSGRDDVPGKLRLFLARHLRMQEGIAVAEPPGGLSAMADLIARHKLKALVVTGAVSSMAKRRSGGEMCWDVTITLTVLSHPGKSIRAMINGKSTVSRALRVYKPDDDFAMQDRAIEDAVRGAAEDIASRLKEI